jgi:hypothetical protein
MSTWNEEKDMSKLIRLGTISKETKSSSLAGDAFDGTQKSGTSHELCARNDQDSTNNVSPESTTKPCNQSI